MPIQISWNQRLDKKRPFNEREKRKNKRPRFWITAFLANNGTHTSYRNVGYHWIADNERRSVSHCSICWDHFRSDFEVSLNARTLWLEREVRDKLLSTGTRWIKYQWEYIHGPLCDEELEISYNWKTVLSARTMFSWFPNQIILFRRFWQKQMNENNHKRPEKKGKQKKTYNKPIAQV